MISIKNVSKQFSSKKILNDISLDIKNGEIVGIYGNNGSGKSTFLRILSGIFFPDNGKISIEGDEKKSEKNTCFLNSETHSLYERLTGFQNLKYFCSLFQIPYNNEAIMEFSKKIDMENHLDCKVSNYSMGMKQKLNIMIAFLRTGKTNVSEKSSIDCNLFLLDEITDHLDQKTIDFVQKQMITFSKADATIIECSRKRDNLHPDCNRIFKLELGKLEQIL